MSGIMIAGIIFEIVCPKSLKGADINGARGVVVDAVNDRGLLVAHKRLPGQPLRLDPRNFDGRSYKLKLDTAIPCRMIVPMVYKPEGATFIEKVVKIPLAVLDAETVGSFSKKSNGKPPEETEKSTKPE